MGGDLGSAYRQSRALTMLAVLGVLGTPTAGCSFLFVQGPPSPTPQRGPIECTTNVAAPAIDAVVAALEVVRVAYALSQSDSDYAGFPISRGADIGFGLAFATLFGLSSAHGLQATAACRASKGRAAQRALRPPEALDCRRDDQCKGDRVCEVGVCVPPRGASRSAASSSASDRVTPLHEPIGAFGHGFGALLDAVSTACTESGGVFEATGTDTFECRGTQAKQREAPVVTLRFCANALCEVDAAYTPDPPVFHAWMARYDEIEEALRRELGPPTSRQRLLASQCASDLRACLESASTTISTLWRWPTGSQVWLRGSRDGLLRLTYTGATHGT